MNDLPYDFLNGDSSGNFGFSLDGFEHAAFRLLSFLQQYGVLAVVVVILLMVVIRYVFITSQNTRFQQMFSKRAIMLFLLAVFLILTPYVVFNYLEGDIANSEGNQLPSNDEAGSYIVRSIPYFQVYVYVLTVHVTLAMFVWRFIYGIRKNDRLRQKYLNRAVGMITVCLLFYLIPSWILKFL